MVEPLTIYIGWDAREQEAYSVCVNSLEQNTSSKLNIIPLKKNELEDQNLYWRDEIHPGQGSTEFAFTRFLVPVINRYKGWALFVDCDFVFTTDIKKLFDLADPQYAVMCVQHDYVPKSEIKMDGQHQKSYPRKNWSSLMLFNNAHIDCLSLYPTSVSHQNAGWLHEMRWTENIGSIPKVWNWLVDENGYKWDNREELPFGIHYTLGCPFMEGYENCSFASVYNTYKE
jgi:lipopolysaccharide biosynthesis glycosyltransferase